MSENGMSSQDATVDCVRPEVSVLMAVFDTPTSYLDEAIGSILSQSFTDFEFIIIDDGSGTETESRLRYWSQCDPRIRLHREGTNIGLTRALNVGLRLTRGTFIARQDADDVSERGRLESQRAFMLAYPEVDALGTGATIINGLGAWNGEPKIVPDISVLPHRNPLVHGAMMFRRWAIEVVGGYDERMRLAQDYELYLRMTRKHGMKLEIIPQPLYRLRNHDASLSSRRMLKQLYFAVLAKSLSGSINDTSCLRFWRTFLYDLFVTHRLFLGRAFKRHLRSNK
jgi:glycosyltransferase involved in cell wall biosynthesis